MPHGGAWLQVTSRRGRAAAALPGASRRCPLCPSRRVLCWRLWLHTCCRPAPLVTRRQQLHCNTQPQLGRAAGGWRGASRRCPQGRQLRAVGSRERGHGSRRMPSAVRARATDRMAGRAGWAGRGFERGAARRRMSPPHARSRPRCADLAPRSIACLAISSQQYKPHHSGRPQPALRRRSGWSAPSGRDRLAICAARPCHAQWRRQTIIQRTSADQEVDGIRPCAAPAAEHAGERDDCS